MKILTLMAAVISMAAVTSAYANEDHTAKKEARVEAKKACKEEGKKGKELKECIKEKVKK